MVVLTIVTMGVITIITVGVITIITVGVITIIPVGVITIITILSPVVAGVAQMNLWRGQTSELFVKQLKN